YTASIRNLSTEKITDVAKAVLAPSSLIWVIVGDREKIEPEIHKLNFGEIRLIDSDGNILQ
ncbi:MAG: hypothetical protein KBG83_01355, partial [Bacteroidetes bacterium]|nr:hypothetical protein [Bacteroidota bacterium]